MTWSPWGELARHPDVWVHRCRLEGAHGWWCPEERVILLDERLDRRTARCVLAHELGHMALGHHGGPTFADGRWLARRQESDADRWAAARLVDVHELARAAAERPTDLAAVARQLRVTEHMLQVWMRHAKPRARELLRGVVSAADHAA